MKAEPLTATGSHHWSWCRSWTPQCRPIVPKEIHKWLLKRPGTGLLLPVSSNLQVARARRQKPSGKSRNKPPKSLKRDSCCIFMHGFRLFHGCMFPCLGCKPYTLHALHRLAPIILYNISEYIIVVYVHSISYTHTICAVIIFISWTQVETHELTHISPLKLTS